jgi:hypothetical protein
MTPHLTKILASAGLIYKIRSHLTAFFSVFAKLTALPSQRILGSCRRSTLIFFFTLSQNMFTEFCSSKDILRILYRSERIRFSRKKNRLSISFKNIEFRFIGISIKIPNLSFISIKYSYSSGLATIPNFRYRYRIDARIVRY